MIVYVYRHQQPKRSTLAMKPNCVKCSTESKIFSGKRKAAISASHHYVYFFHDLPQNSWNVTHNDNCINRHRCYIFREWRRNNHDTVLLLYYLIFKWHSLHIFALSPHKLCSRLCRFREQNTLYIYHIHWAPNDDDNDNNKTKTMDKIVHVISVLSHINSSSSAKQKKNTYLKICNRFSVHSVIPPGSIPLMKITYFFSFSHLNFLCGTSPRVALHCYDL